MYFRICRSNTWGDGFTYLLGEELGLTLHFLEMKRIMEVLGSFIKGRGCSILAASSCACWLSIRGGIKSPKAHNLMVCGGSRGPKWPHTGDVVWCWREHRWDGVPGYAWHLGLHPRLGGVVPISNPIFSMQRQDNWEYSVIFGYILSSRTTRAIQNSVSKCKNKQNLIQTMYRPGI